MGKVIMSGIVPKLNTPVVPSNDISANDLAVGNSVFIKVNGVLTEFIVVNKGIPSNSSLYDSSCNGTWLLMRDCYEIRQWHNTNSVANNYRPSDIHSYLNGAFLNLFDSGTRSKIKTVKIPYINAAGGYNSNIASGSNGLSAQIFLLAGYEVGWTESTNQWIPIDGACLSYFKGTAETDSKRIAYLNGIAEDWWLRSPYLNGSNAALCVSYSGGRDFFDCNNTSIAIRPALILTSDTLFDGKTMELKGVA